MADTALMQEVMESIHNWFPHSYAGGRFSITDGALVQDVGLKNGQYYRVTGSVFNDGLHQHPDTSMYDEEFDGEVWLLAVPQSFSSLCDEIAAYVEKNPADDALVSESFGGYSYTKGTSSVTGVAAGWRDAFRLRLNPYRKLP